MSVTELERAEMVGELVAATSPKTVETLMKCVLPEGRDHLATKKDLGVLKKDLEVLKKDRDHLATKKDLDDLALKKDLEVLEHALRADFAELKAYVESSLAESRAEFAELRAHVDSSLAELRAEFAELRAHVDSSLADLKSHNEAMHGKQTRLLMTSLAGFAVSTWTPMLVYLAV